VATEVGTTAAGTRHASHFVATLRRALKEDAEREIEFTVRVAVLLAAGRQQPDVEQLLGLSAPSCRLP
jgi:hypothetical protein